MSHFHCSLRHNPTVSPGVSHCYKDEDESFLVLVSKSLDLRLVLSQKLVLVFNTTALPTPVGFLMLSHFYPCLPWTLSEPPKAVSCDRNSFLSGSSRDLGQELLSHPILACSFTGRAYWLGLDCKHQMTSKPDAMGAG